MVFKSILGAVGTCVFITTFTCNAALVSVDWKTAGDNLITRDTVTGLEWLDLTETAVRSYNDVSSQLGIGGEFGGWQYATTSQIEGLFDSAGGTGPYNGWSLSHKGTATTLLNLWGAIVPGDATTNPASGFIQDQLASTGAHIVGTISYSAETGFLAASVRGLGDTATFIDSGSALVRVSAVPAPAAIWLFGSGLIGLIGIARRKANA